MDNVNTFDGILGKLNGFLTKIRNMNIFTKCVIVCYVYKQFKKYMAMFEEYKSKYI